jgi:hypothetical protein
MASTPENRLAYGAQARLPRYARPQVGPRMARKIKAIGRSRQATAYQVNSKG